MEFDFIGTLVAKINSCWVLEEKAGHFEFFDNGKAFNMGDKIKITLKPVLNESSLVIEDVIVDDEKVRVNLGHAYLSLTEETCMDPMYFSYAEEFWKNITIGKRFAIKTEVV